MNDRRRNQRIGLSLPVECVFLPQRNYFYTVAKDISLNGLKIISESFISPGKMIKVNINFIDCVINFKAKVTWCNKEKYTQRYAAGLEFLEMDKSARKYINQFLSSIYPA